MNGYKGFTLIEMVAVIIILAIMAAVALPRFADLQKEARVAAMNGVSGGMRSAAALAKSKWIVLNSTALDTVSMETYLVSVVSGTSVWSGYPTAAYEGILAALNLEPRVNFDSMVIGDTVSLAYAGIPTCFITYQSGAVSADLLTVNNC